VPVGDAGAVADVLRGLIADPGRAAAIGAAARADVQQRYAFDRMVGAFEDLYVSALRMRSASGARGVEAASI
jgi:hypothetical protein